MAKKPESVTITLTPEEIATIMAIREGRSVEPSRSDAHKELADAFISAINATKPPEKKTPFNRPKHGPWEPKDGRKKPTLKRVMHQHGIELNEGNLLPEEIELLNKIKPGSYCGGFVRVIRRKDRSLDIDYPVRTASQRLKLVNQFGITNFVSLLNRLIAEASDPAKFKGPDDDE